MQTWQKFALGCAGLAVLGVLLAVVLAVGIALGGVLAGGDSPSGPPMERPDQYRDNRGGGTGFEQYGQYGPGGGTTETITVRVTGTEGLRFTGTISTLDGSRSVEGTVPEEYETEIQSGTRSFDYVSGAFSRDFEDDKEGTLKVEIVSDGRVVEEAETDARAGSVTVNWSPNE